MYVCMYRYPIPMHMHSLQEISENEVRFNYFLKRLNFRLQSTKSTTTSSKQHNPPIFSSSPNPAPSHPLHISTGAYSIGCSDSSSASTIRRSVWPSAASVFTTQRCAPSIHAATNTAHYQLCTGAVPASAVSRFSTAF